MNVGEEYEIIGEFGDESSGLSEALHQEINPKLQNTPFITHSDNGSYEN